MKKIRSSIVAIAAVIALSACANVRAKQKTRAIASVSECPAASEAFEAALQQYNSCKYGGQGCQAFCDAAAPLAGGGDTGPVNPPVPTDPTEVCRGPGRYAQERADLDVSSQATNIQVYGWDERECVDAALTSQAAFDLENSCNQSAVCLKNCSAESYGRPRFNDIRPEKVTIVARVSKDKCKPGEKERCTAMCHAAIPNFLENLKAECAKKYGVASCQGRVTGEVFQDWYDDGYTRCKAPGETMPDDIKISCDVPVKATNKLNYGGRRGGSWSRPRHGNRGWDN